MARPSKYTPERRKLILDAIRVGTPFKLACQFAGIDEKTFANWRARYSDFSAAVKEAEGAMLVTALAVIATAAQNGTWQAAAWLAERKYPQEFGARQRVDVYEHEKVRQEAERIAERFGVTPEAVLQRAGISLPQSPAN